jgi:hypothetical protein
MIRLSTELVQRSIVHDHKIAVRGLVGIRQLRGHDPLDPRVVEPARPMKPLGANLAWRGHEDKDVEVSIQPELEDEGGVDDRDHVTFARALVEAVLEPGEKTRRRLAKKRDEWGGKASDVLESAGDVMEKGRKRFGI